jgi:hypothetical protein
MARWRSSAVTLVVIGVAGVASCSPEPQTYRRNLYATKGDCYRDYGPADCEASSYRAGYFFGAPYWVGGGRRPAGDPGPGASAVNGRSGVALAVSDPVRGGFGATGRSYSGSRGG